MTEICYTDEDLPPFDEDEPFDMDAAVENEYNFGKVVYKDNGVEITACASEMNYVIDTDKYHIYWYVDPSSDLIVYTPAHRIDPRNCERPLLSFKKPFDMSFFAQLKSPSMPGEIEFIYSSADFVNQQVERLLNLKVFL